MFSVVNDKVYSKQWVRCAHLGGQLLHVGVYVVQQVVALLEQGVLGVHEGQHLGRGKMQEEVHHRVVCFAAPKSSVPG